MTFTHTNPHPFTGELVAANKDVARRAMSQAAIFLSQGNRHFWQLWHPNQHTLRLRDIAVWCQNLDCHTPILYVFNRVDGIKVPCQNSDNESTSHKTTCSKWSSPDGTLYDSLKEAIAGNKKRAEVDRQKANGEWMSILSFDDFPKFPAYFVALRSFAECEGLDRLRVSPTVVRYLGDGSFEGWDPCWPDPTHWAPLPTVLTPRSFWGTTGV